MHSRMCAHARTRLCRCRRRHAAREAAGGGENQRRGRERGRQRERGEGVKRKRAGKVRGGGGGGDDDRRRGEREVPSRRRSWSSRRRKLGDAVGVGVGVPPQVFTAIYCAAYQQPTCTALPYRRTVCNDYYIIAYTFLVMGTYCTARRVGMFYCACVYDVCID